MTKLAGLIVAEAVLIAGAVDAAAAPQITAVLNAASFQNGLPWGGGLATIYCIGVTGVNPGTYVAPSGPSLPYSLGGLSVKVNNATAPMLAAVIDSSGNAQINFQVPMERNAEVLLGNTSQYGVQLYACGVVTQVQGGDAGGFFADANGYAIAQHSSDYSLVTTQNPARPGETIVAYADDFFQVWPPPPIGIPVPLQPLFQIVPTALVSLGNFVSSSGAYLYLQTYPQPSCLIGGGCDKSFATTPALRVTFEGLAPGMTGVEQINFVVPASQQAGNWALFFNVGSCPNGGGAGTCSPSGGSSPYALLPVQ